MKEMPEGWKRLYHQITHDYDAYSCLDEEMIEAFNLLAEMAEALERVNEGYHTNIQECMNHVAPALKKFKEWK